MPRPRRQDRRAGPPGGREGDDRRGLPRRGPGSVRLLAAALLLPVAAACADSGPAGPELDALARQLGLEALPPVPHPEDNPPDPKRVELGRLLFFDPVLSGTKDASCGTCHHPQFGMTDGRDLPAGASGRGLGPDRVLTDPDIPLEARNSPTTVNVAFNQFAAQVTAAGFMFWDGRARSLERLAILPLLERSEMRGDAYPVQEAVDSAMARLREIPEYRALFRDAFPERAAEVDAGEAEFVVDSLRYARAVAQFVRAQVGDDSPYDRFVAGDGNALSPAQKRGLLLFHGKAGCAECHSGPMLSDFRFHVVGARQQGPGFRFTPHEDFGRWIVTELESQRWAFRTPSLRNAAETGPYMHAGGYATLREVVEFFDRGGGDEPSIPRRRLDPALEPLGLSEREKEDLVAFLESLTDLPEVEVPERVPSGLPPAVVER